MADATATPILAAAPAATPSKRAILQGFFELIERDNVAIWWYNRLRRPALDLDSFDEPFIHELRKQYQALDRDLWVLDLTADLPIPTFAAISRVNSGPVEHLIRGFGAHIDPRVAVMRALTEARSMPPRQPPRRRHRDTRSGRRSGFSRLAPRSYARHAAASGAERRFSATTLRLRSPGQ